MAHLSLRGIMKSIFMTVLNLAAGVGLVVLAAGLLAAEAPDGDRDLRAYESATRCQAPPRAPADCRWTAKFTVSDVRLTSKRGESDSAVLTDADGDGWETSYPNSGPVLNTLDEGDRVTGTVWRGRLTEIAAMGQSQRTHAAPVDMRTRVLIGALILVPGGVLMTAASTWRLLRLRARPEPTPGMVATLGLAYALFLAGLFSPLLVSAGGENFRTTLAVWVPIAAVMTAAAFVSTARKRRTMSAPG
ncbi:hypothetical protein [Actinomadura livida]|uniref:Uncharacterized protein n=1 Tax=Actinomadura livida TaxID=79909 RepID=A0A7W7IIU2_9ACTN|nr:MULTISPECIES: hypothetical protein [Actinomadura]MBB4777766.1 hypothetical protein [Actinomadura catellatispora]GGT98885.1 hypothetical protein GCM10010208_23060 [Actinomadura livida]